MLVRCQKKGNPNDNLEDSDIEYDSDLDINFITKLEDFDITNDETDLKNQFQLDPQVWKNPIKPLYNNKVEEHGNMAQKISLPTPPGLKRFPSNINRETNAPHHSIGGASLNPKIIALEEIERNLINQQHIQRQQNLLQEKLTNVQSKVFQQVAATSPPPHIHLQQNFQKQLHMRKILTDQNAPPFQGIIFPSHLGIGSPHPPGFPPVSTHLQGHKLSKFNPLITLPNHQIHINNFPASFSGPLQMRQGIQRPSMSRLPQHLINISGNSLMFQNSQNSAQFNQRLVQEIQQNHPMLNPIFQRQQFHGNNHNFVAQNNRIFNCNGKPEEYDEYANLMSNRDKQFLITIQLMQLNTETPYFDDYYFTIYKERQQNRRIEKTESQAHRDNQMNHPFTQPKGHAQLLLRQFNCSKTSLQNQINSHERGNSESPQINDKEPVTPRTYAPLQFENSLGKLQCGSVTAPRKIIDMEIVGIGDTGGQSSTSEISTQKRSRQILMQIELLYKTVLKLEDLQHPMAISATMILKVKF